MDPVSIVSAVEGWMDEAACQGHDPDVFFPSLATEHNRMSQAKRDAIRAENLRRQSPALAICATCPVKDPCLRYALSMRLTDGVWGGATEAQRRTMIGNPRYRPAGVTFRARRQKAAHGTRACYNTGCRLLECREANKRYMEMRRLGA